MIMITRVLSIFLILTAACFAMDDERGDIELGSMGNNRCTSTGTGLTIKDGVDLLWKRHFKPEFVGEEPGRQLVSCLKGSSIGMIFLMVPGFIPGGILALGGCIGDPNGMEQSPGIGSPVCIAGLSIIGLAVVGMATVAITHGIYRCYRFFERQRWLAQKRKSIEEQSKSDQELYARFLQGYSNGRDISQPLIREDFKWLGYNEIICSEVREKLTPCQALWIAELRPYDLSLKIKSLLSSEINYIFSKDADVYVVKFMELLSLKSVELLETLTKSDTRLLFEKEPALLDSLERSLSEEHRIDELLRNQ